MRPLSLTFRLFAFGFALAQYALAGVFAVLDARLDTQSVQAVQAHIESPIDPCGVAHHSVDCAVCHWLGLRVGAAKDPYVVPEMWATTRIVEDVVTYDAPTRTVDRLLLPRAPPARV